MKNKLSILVLSLSFLFLVVSVAFAKPREVKEKKGFSLPPTAIQVSDDVYYLGKSKDVNGKEVEGFAFIRRKGPEAKGGNPVKPPKGSSCYGFLAKGAKWKGIPEDWIVNPANTRALDGSFVFGSLGADISKWEVAAGKDILGQGSSTDKVLEADTTSPDGENEVYFADIKDSDTIAVTIIWGYFSGPPQTRQLLEWDQVYDDVTFDWSLETAGVTGKMDFENIATHELGHSVGMNDIYTTGCSEVTMYGYAGYGETKKRTLEIPDITGVSKLYE